MTAAAGDQTAKPLEEAKHGMFSYFLMKAWKVKLMQIMIMRLLSEFTHMYKECHATIIRFTDT